ncbi:hypothetical protein EMIHUDRAFT_211121 [Emiliania huxleyi CCMP1516]|uniref:Lon N-terminal domain-containing protein n=2 Tax=Emiliania huxleyi TaxID=2903 RepID=A0A0D3IXR8_EMIH1|nr:hypothetical protein EMIHUDRAFT_211121 [Emiliania huxleyi CCMP1516]EOD16053.1 hypothetical protein EMIHUDRAFT_211121 [Emiliania huxleyi CCMP1516]|eukprot:XP_005768482.1 hypothetical protein EMIHUDRAFT_211121 [Emiliania huxleyi CCMP1516]
MVAAAIILSKLAVAYTFLPYGGGPPPKRGEADGSREAQLQALGVAVDAGPFRSRREATHLLRRWLEQYWECKKLDSGDNSCFEFGGCHRRCWWRGATPELVFQLEELGAAAAPPDDQPLAYLRARAAADCLRAARLHHREVLRLRGIVVSLDASHHYCALRPAAPEGAAPRVHSLGVRASAVALYPLPAVYLPGSQCVVRNIEARNIAMCRERAEFVAARVSADRASCASVGALLRIDDVRPAPRDYSGRVLAEGASENERGVLEVRCSVVGRVRVVACANLEAWRKPQRDEYLEVWWMGAAAASDVADAIYQLIDALLATDGLSGAAGAKDIDALVGSLERAAALAEEADWWGALELWQAHCATRQAGAAAAHRAERDELLIDAKLRQGGALQIPVREETLEQADRARLADLDARAADAIAQTGVDDASAFQACLEARTPAERAAILLHGVQREAERLARRAALERALGA